MGIARKTQTIPQSLSWWFTVVIALQATTAWAGKGERMDFKTVRLGTFEKSACSPTPDPEAKQGVSFNMPKQIAWGAPLPVCGLVQTGAERGEKPLTIRIFIDFAQPISHNRQLMGVLVEGDRAQPVAPGASFYFNFDGLAPTAWAALPPGDYQVRLDADHGLLSSPPLPLHVVAAGWRKDLAEAVVLRVCKKKLLADLAPYFEYLDILSIETPASPEIAAANLASLREKWRRGFAPHAAMLTPKIREGLKGSTKPDPGLAEHTWQSVRKQCRKRSPERARVLGNLLQAIQEYEIQR